MPDNLIGKQLGQFHIIEEVGRGGMASVYRARQTSINRIVAIKVLPPMLLHDPSFYERFVREVDVVAHLEHPHILPIYDYGEVDGTPYIAMRYLAGGSMAQWIRRSLPPLDKLAKPVEQIASALDYAHQQGIIHRDIKPGNVLLDENGNAYLSDFGIARVLDSNMTGSAIIGTPAYMSPEQANGLPLDARSDIYSLGVVLFELITGREPFEAETPVALLLKHINEPMPSARELRPELPLAAEYVINKATAKQPDARYPSAIALSDAFSAALHHAGAVVVEDDEDQPTLMDPGSLGDPVERRPTPPPAAGTRSRQTPRPTPRPATQPSAQPPPAAEIAAEPPVTNISGRRRTSTLVVAAVIVVVLILGVGIALVATRNSPPPVVLPTPFANAYTVQRSQYTVSVPENWTFSDASSALGMAHLWQLNKSAFVEVWLVDKSKLQNANDLTALADAFDTQGLPQRDTMKLIDTTIAEDGSLRRSYRISGADGSGFPAGQTDVFYLDRGKYLAVVETYSAYATGNDLVPTFQAVLDSLRVNQA